jgi:hypothetical protein
LVGTVLREYSELTDHTVHVDPTAGVGDPLRAASQEEREILNEAMELAEIVPGDVEAARECAVFTSALGVPGFLDTDPEVPEGCDEDLPPVFALGWETLPEGLRIIGVGWDKELAYRFIAEVGSQGSKVEWAERSHMPNRM